MQNLVEMVEHYQDLTTKLVTWSKEISSRAERLETTSYLDTPYGRMYIVDGEFYTKNALSEEAVQEIEEQETVVTLLASLSELQSLHKELAKRIAWALPVRGWTLAGYYWIRRTGSMLDDILEVRDAC